MSTGLPKALVSVDPVAEVQRTERRQNSSWLFNLLCFGVAMISVVVLIVLLLSIAYQGSSSVNSTLLTNSHDAEDPSNAGMFPSILGSIFVCALCALTALPIGIGSAIFLEEFRPTNKYLKMFHGLVQLNISNLAGVPSIVYGLLGLTVFVYMFQLFGRIEPGKAPEIEFGADRYYQVLTLEPGHTVLAPVADATKQTTRITEAFDGFDTNRNPIRVEIWDPSTPEPKDVAVRKRTVKKNRAGGFVEYKSWYYFRLPFGQSFIAAGLTLSLVILPIVVIASQEAIRAVPSSLKEASFGLGATKWQTVKNVVLPSALPGIMTGAILAMGRAIGEAAPIFVVLGGDIAKRMGPQNLMDSCVTMPILIYGWSGNPKAEYHQLAAGAIIILLIVLIIMNSLAIYVRQTMQQKAA